MVKNSQVQIVATGDTKTIYRVARTKQELKEVFSLVYKEYQKRGYIPKGYKSRLRISLFNALPSTTTFVAKQGKDVVAGVTLISDSSMGLPMDKLYKAELDELRKKGRKIAEVSQLAIDTTLFGTGYFSMFNFNKLIFVFKLFKVIFDYALNVGQLTDFCIAINPKQQYLYKFLTFEQIGPLRYYDAVNRAPAVAFRLDLTAAEERNKHRKGIYKIFFGNVTDPELFQNKISLSLKDLRYFFVKKSDIFKKAKKEQIEYIRSLYGREEFDKVIRY